MMLQENILIIKKVVAKIGDFGLVNLAGAEVMTKNIGTQRYMAPEMAPKDTPAAENNYSYTNKVDIYRFVIDYFVNFLLFLHFSLGITTYEIFASFGASRNSVNQFAKVA